MKYIFVYSKKEKVRINTMGSTSNLLVMLVAISRLLVDRISKEKKVNIAEAENFVLECISDGMKTISK